MDEPKAISRVTAIHGGLAILTVGLFAYLTDLPLVSPVLGPSAFILFSSPLSKAGAPRSVILGYCICLAVGLTIWHCMSYLTGSPISLDSGGWPVFVSATLTLALSALFLVRFSCPHPPACASGLMVAFGTLNLWYQPFLMFAMVVWLTGQSVVMNRFAGFPVPLWSPRQIDPC